MTFDDLKALLKLTFRNPEEAAKTLMSFGWPSSARWMGLLLAVSASALLAWISVQLSPLPEVEVEVNPVLDIISQPFLFAGLQFLALLMTAGLMAAVGQIFNGKGSFDDALLLTVWLQIVSVLLQIIQLATLVLLPPLSVIITLIEIALFFWLTVQFTKALHGFQSGAKVLLVMIGTAFVLAFAMALVITGLGIMPPVPQVSQ